MRRHSILIVEDDDDLRGFYATVLALEGYVVRQAPDGLDALQIVESSPPDLIVLDLHLRLVSGFIVHQEVAAQAATRQIPIVIVTATPLEDIDPVAMPCVLRKPVSADLLVRTVRECLASGAGKPSSRATL